MSINPNVVRGFTLIGASGGPRESASGAQAFAADLHKAARSAVELAGELTGLSAQAERAAETPVYVLDRPGWGYAVAQSLDAMVQQAQDCTENLAASLSSMAVGIGAAALARFIMGQFDPYGDGSVDAHSQRTGRLLLVAPNIAAFREKYNLDQRDLCLWVCVHELTHAIQYQAAPWLGEFIVDRFAQILSDTDKGQDLDSDPARELIAVMSVLEGHAEHTMNAVGVAHMPGKTRIISAMEHKRSQKNPFIARLGRALGLHKKTEQYKNGARFVREVTAKAGQATFNRVWERIEMMPTPEEISDPGVWLKRIEADDVHNPKAE